jgi:hypothetical protein
MESDRKEGGFEIMVKYAEFESIKEKINLKKIVSWGSDFLILEDKTKIEIVCSDQECCAGAGGEFSNVVLDALITDVVLGEVKSEEDDTITNSVTVSIFHNQNPIAIAECQADAGNGGYYYSVCSFKIGDIHYQVVTV